MSDAEQEARRYVELSNEHNLNMISSMFDSDLRYHSSQFGEFSGKETVMHMMKDFFTRFPDVHWEVDKYEEIEPSIVEFEFLMKGSDQEEGKQVERRGRECISFGESGLIVEVSESNP